jgi:hypothetical protein
VRYGEASLETRISKWFREEHLAAPASKSGRSFANTDQRYGTDQRQRHSACALAASRPMTDPNYNFFAAVEAANAKRNPRPRYSIYPRWIGGLAATL